MIVRSLALIHPLAGQDEEGDDIGKRILALAGRVVHGSDLSVGKDAPAGRAPDGNHALAWVVGDVSSGRLQCPSEEDLDCDQRVVPLRGRVYDPVDPAADVVGRDVGQLLAAKRKVLLEQARVVAERARSEGALFDPLLALREKELLCLVIGNALRAVLAERPFRKYPLGLGARVGERDNREAADAAAISAAH